MFYKVEMVFQLSLCVFVCQTANTVHKLTCMAMQQVPKRKREPINILDGVNITEETECLGKGITHSVVRDSTATTAALHQDLIKC